MGIPVKKETIFAGKGASLRGPAPQSEVLAGGAAGKKMILDEHRR
jgi:hypothetical protein